MRQTECNPKRSLHLPVNNVHPLGGGGGGRDQPPSLSYPPACLGILFATTGDIYIFSPAHFKAYTQWREVNKL